MHNHDDKYPAPPGFEPGTSRLQDPVDTNESSGPVTVVGEYLELMIRVLVAPCPDHSGCKSGFSHS